MHVTEKLTRPLTEAKYLNADNADRYRSIMRIFYENYEKLKYRMYQEEVYAQMTADPYFADYRDGAVPAGSRHADGVEELKHDPGYAQGVFDRRI